MISAVVLDTILHIARLVSSDRWIAEDGIIGDTVLGVDCHFFFFSSRRRHTRCGRDWSSDVCSSDLHGDPVAGRLLGQYRRVIPGEPTPARHDRRGAWRHGLAGAGETHSRSPQRYAALRRLSAWIDRMSIFSRLSEVRVTMTVTKKPSP